MPGPATVYSGRDTGKAIFVEELKYLLALPYRKVVGNIL